MVQSNCAEESRDTVSAGTTGSPALRRSARGTPEKKIVTSVAERKADRVENQSGSNLLRRSERGKSQSPLKSNQITKKCSSMSDAKVIIQALSAGISEGGAGAKRRKTNGKSFKASFGKKTIECVSSESSEKRKMVETLTRSTHRATGTEGEDKYHSASNQSEISEKKSERCKANHVEVDSSARVDSEVQSVGVLTVSDKDEPTERDTETHASLPENSPLSPSRDSTGLTPCIERDMVELSDGSLPKTKTRDMNNKENSLHVEDEETRHSRERNADDINNIARVSDWGQAICSDSSNVSLSRNKAKDLFGGSASTPGSHRKRKIVDYYETDGMRSRRKINHDSIERDKLHDTKKSLHLLLKPEFQRLCKLLNLSEDVKKKAERFLEFVVENHHITREPVAQLQAFQMSVCWIAASLRKPKIDCQESLALARRNLSFCCSADDTDYVYLNLILWKELFIQSTADEKTNGNACNAVFPVRDTSDDYLVSLNPKTSEGKSPRVFDTKELMVKIIRQINKKFKERMNILIENQRKEFEELQKSCDEERAQLENGYKMESAVLRTIHSHNLSLAAEKLKALDGKQSEKLEELNNNLDIRSKSLKEKHASEKDKENELTSSWKEVIVKEQYELLRKFTCYNLEDGKRKCHSKGQLGGLDSQKDRFVLEDQELLKNQPDILAERFEDYHSATPAMPPASSETGNNFIVIDSVVSASSEVLLENSGSILSKRGQLASGQAANFVDLTSDMEVPESSSDHVLSPKSSSPALTAGCNYGKRLDCLSTSQQLSPSAKLVPNSELTNPLTVDVPLAPPSNKVISVQHESKKSPIGQSVPLSPSTAALDNQVVTSSPVSASLFEADNGLPPGQPNVEVPLPPSTAALDNEVVTSSPVSILKADNGLQPSQLNVEAPAAGGLPEIPSSSISTGSKQSLSDIQLLHSTSGLPDVDPTEMVGRQLPGTEGQPQFPSSSSTPISEKSDSDTEKQPELPSSAITAGAEYSHLDIQLLHTTTGLPNVNLPAAEAVVQPPATKGRPHFLSSCGTPGYEQDHSDIHLDEPLHRNVNNSNVESAAARAVQPLSVTEEQAELPSSNGFVGTEQSRFNIDQSLLHRAAGQFDPSTGEALQLSPAAENEADIPSSITLGEGELPSSTTAPGVEQSHSDVQLGQLLPQIVTDHSNIDQYAAEAVQPFSATDGQLELPSSTIAPRSEQPDSDYQLDKLLRQTATDNVEPSAREAAHQFSHPPLVESSSSQQHSSIPLLEELPSGRIGATLATNPSPSSSVVRTSSILPTSTAVSQSPTNSEPRATITITDFPTSMIPGATVASNVAAHVPMHPYLDPLQCELERIQKEVDQSVKEYEEMKRLLNSECEKEITQIRKKYETKNVELDAAMKYKKNELDVYLRKVHMNRLLAETFRNKCMDPKAFVPSGIPQDNVQHQLRRDPPESVSRPPSIVNAQNLLRPRGPSSAPSQNVPRHGSIAAPSIHPRSSYVASSPVYSRPGGPSFGPSQNVPRHGGIAAPLQNSIHPGSSSVASSPVYSRPSFPAAPVSLLAVQMSGSLQASHNPIRPSVTTGISLGTPLTRSTSPSSSGLASTSPRVSPVLRSMSTSPADQQPMPRPVQMGNRPAPLFPGNSVRPMSTSAAPPAVNLHSVSGIRAPAPHLRSRVSQPGAPNTTLSSCIPTSACHLPYTSVSLSAPSAVNQHHSPYHRPPATQSTNVGISTQQELRINTGIASPIPSNIENGGRNGMAANGTHSQTAVRNNEPPQRRK